jgi:predicted ribonuclease YlaK
MFGIYVDWQIDTNLMFNDPHGIKKFEDHLDIDTFQVVTILHDNQEKLVINVS